MWFVDAAGEKSAEPNWIPNSVMVWKIPIGWHRRGESDDWFRVSRPDYELFEDAESRKLMIDHQYIQRFSIDNDGVFKVGVRSLEQLSEFVKENAKGLIRLGHTPKWLSEFDDLSEAVK